MGGRIVSIPLLWVGEGLLLGGAHFQALADVQAGIDQHPRIRRIAWALTGSGLGLYLASRIARFVFAGDAVCRSPGCIYGYDQVTLGVSRALAFPGSALLVYHRTRSKAHLGLTPFGSLGLAVVGEF